MDLENTFYKLSSPLFMVLPRDVRVPQLVLKSRLRHRNPDEMALELCPRFICHNTDELRKCRMISETMEHPNIIQDAQSWEWRERT